MNGPGPIFAGNSGQSAPQLPAWTLTTGAIGSGLFTADNAAIGSTVNLLFSKSVAGALLDSDFWSTWQPGALLVLTNSAGGVIMIRPVLPFADGGSGNIQVTRGAIFNFSGTTNWSGKYTLSVSPVNTGLLAADTGWTANQSVGDKTIAVQNYDSTTLDGMTAGLNLVLAGFGTAIAQLADQVEDLTKKFQASETALANSLRPNA